MVNVDNKCLLLGGFTLLMYFMWMDIALWYNLQALTPSDKSSTEDQPFSVFYPITVKLLMTDPVNHYIFIPCCYIFTQATRFTETLPWLTPNLISLLRLLVVLPSVRLLLSDSLSVRRAGVAVLVLGEWLDALDGYVARLTARRRALTSEVGQLGYYLDGICDGISCAIMMFTCLAYMKRHPPRLSGTLQLPNICSQVESGSAESKESLLESGDGSPLGPRTLVPPRAISATFYMVGAQLFVASVGWNHAMTGYQQALQNPDGSHSEKQLVVLKASSTWILMWFWRIFCFHSLVVAVMVAVVFNKTWDFVSSVRYIGFVALAALIVFNEIHLQTISIYL